MNCLSVSRALALSVLVLAGASAPVLAQDYPGDTVYSQPANGQTSQSDYARVIRVDPVLDGYATSSTQRCYERPTYVNGGNDGYEDGYYRRDNGYYDQYGNYRRNTSGTETGRTMATAIGGIVGAVVGSQVGGGSARYATSAIGSLVGGLAGRQIYEQSKRSEDRVGAVRVCDPVPAGSVTTGNGDYSGDRRAYDVTYEYAGRTYVTRTNYHPGDRIRVRVDVRPE
jgi:uncharacterized protein YcfJ